MPITLLRHTLPAITPGTCYGVSDIDVAASFRRDCAIALALTEKPTAILSSPLRRCEKLAQAAARHFDLPYECDPDLMEMDFGRWENVAWDAIPRSELDQWAEDFMHARPHGGENAAMVYRRAKRAIARYQTHGAAPLLITHGGFIKAALAETDEERCFQTTIAFGSSVTLLHQD